MLLLLSAWNWNNLNTNYRYIPDVTGAIYDVLKGMAQLHASKKQRFEAEDAELLGKVSARVVTKETLMEKLAQYVEQVSSVLWSLNNLQWDDLTEICT